MSPGRAHIQGGDATMAPVPTPRIAQLERHVKVDIEECSLQLDQIHLLCLSSSITLPDAIALWIERAKAVVPTCPT